MWVVFYHTHANIFASMPEEFFVCLFHYGDEAVPLFFAFSGFLFNYVYAQKTRKRLNPFSLDYIYKRFLKLYPVHFDCLSIFLPC